MRLLRLEAENVFSLGHVVLPLYDRKLLLVTGYSNDDKSGNGAGKSSLANHAIVWGLFGQTYDGSKGDAVINRNSDKKFGKVQIAFQDINGNHCTVIRTRNPNSLKLIVQTPMIGPVDSGHRLEKETQAQINHLLGRDFSTFIHSDLIGPGTERSFFKLSGAEQVSVIEKLLPVNSLDTWAATAKWKAKDLQTSLQILENEKNRLIGGYNAVKEHYQSTYNQHAMWESNRFASIGKAQVSLKKLQEEQFENDSKLKVLLDSVGKDWSNHWDDKMKEATQLYGEKSALVAEMGFLEKIIRTDECGACRQLVSEEAKKDAKARLDVEQLKLDAININHKELLTWLDAAKQIKLASSNEPRIDQLKAEIERFEKVENPHEYKSIAEKVSEYEKDIVKFDSQIEELNTQLKWFEFWANGFSKDIRTMMIEEICPFLEQRINEYLKQLGNPQFKATVSTIKSLKSGDIREKFNLEIRSEHGANSFDLLSVGEKQIVSFAASLAVADLATTQVTGRSNVLILDEPFMGLSKENFDNIINFLNNCKVETILLISNEESLKELIPNRIHIVKTKGQSWLE